MQDADLLVQLAGIAGVFVGFGALISVRSGGPREVDEVSTIRWVMSLGIWVVIAALTPVIVNRYDIAAHELWVACSLVALVFWFSLALAFVRAPETREDRTTYSRMQLAAVETGNLLFVVPTMIALVLVVLGLFPDREPALYLTAVGLQLFLGVTILLELVFTHRRPKPASNPAALPAPGGSSA
jgi:Na+/melibiose symporter-like transporter